MRAQGSGVELVSCQGSRWGLVVQGSRLQGGTTTVPYPWAPLPSHHHLSQQPSAEPLACSPTLLQATPCGPGWGPAHCPVLGRLLSVQRLSGQIQLFP